MGSPARAYLLGRGRQRSPAQGGAPAEGPACTSSTGRTSSGWWRTAVCPSTTTWWSSMSCPPSKATRPSGFRALLKVRPRVKRIVGLTGTPSSNGLMDLWAEFRVLDMGRRLGRFITRYRSAYFQPDKRKRSGGVLPISPCRELRTPSMSGSPTSPSPCGPATIWICRNA